MVHGAGTAWGRETYGRREAEERQKWIHHCLIPRMAGVVMAAALPSFAADGVLERSETTRTATGALSSGGVSACETVKHTKEGPAMPRTQSYNSVQDPFNHYQQQRDRGNVSIETIAEEPVEAQNHAAPASKDYTQEENLEEKRAFAEIVGHILERLADRHTLMEKSSTSQLSVDAHSTIFKGSILPTISLPDYCFRILKYGRISSGVMVCGIVYIDFVVKSGKVDLTRYVIHRLLLAACVVAAKVVEDRHLSNKNFSLVGGVSLPELNRLEMELCKVLDFKLTVDPNTFKRYTDTIDKLR